MPIRSRSPSNGRSASGADGSTASGSSNPIREVLVVFLVVYALQEILAIASIGVMTSLFVLEPPVVDNPWTVVTSVYAHGSIGHLLSNSVALVLFGWPVARATTRVRFHVFFVTMGALAGVSQIVVSWTLALLSGLVAAVVPMVTIPVVQPTGGVLGASGAVFALMGYLLAGNRFSSGVASVVQLPEWVAWGAFIVLATVVTLATATPGVALIAHFTGFLLGLLAGRARVLHVGSGSEMDRPAA